MTVTSHRIKLSVPNIKNHSEIGEEYDGIATIIQNVMREYHYDPLHGLPATNAQALTQTIERLADPCAFRLADQYLTPQLVHQKTPYINPLMNVHMSNSVIAVPQTTYDAAVEQIASQYGWHPNGKSAVMEFRSTVREIFIEASKLRYGRTTGVSHAAHVTFRDDMSYFYVHIYQYWIDVMSTLNVQMQMNTAAFTFNITRAFYGFNREAWQLYKPQLQGQHQRGLVRFADWLTQASGAS